MLKHVFFIIVLTISLSLLTISANATTLYVDVNGADTNTGSSGSPFRTIQKGVDTATAGSTVHVNAGTYYERISFTNDGSSGLPITIEGETGTIVDGSDAVTAGSWVAAPEIGTGVYKQTSYAYQPGSMYVVDGGVPIDIPKCHNGSSCATYLAYATDRTVKTTYLGVTINWWDGIEALYYHTGSTLYVRFADNSNPGSKTIRTSPVNGEVFDLTGDSYITLKDMTVRGAHNAIMMDSSSSNNIILDNLTIYATGRSKVRMQNGAHDIEVKNCEIYESGSWLLGPYVPGAWADGSVGTAPHAQAVKEWIYYCYKQYISDEGASDTEGVGIEVGYLGALGAGTNINIHDNTIYDFPSEGVYVRDPAGTVKIHSNTVSGGSSMGIYNSYDKIDNGSVVYVYDNLVYNNGINMRFQGVDASANDRTVYVYNNRFYQPDNISDHIAFHGGSGTAVQNVKFWFYHNSFAGGRASLDIPYTFTTGGGMDNTRFINNIFSANSLVYQTGDPAWTDASFFELFDYNWVGGGYKYYSGYGNPAWGSEGDIYARNSNIWDDSSLPDFLLPDAHAAKEAGIDVSTTFNIYGKIYQPLPGMDPGYYENDKPDIGFDFPNPPENFRSVVN